MTVKKIVLMGAVCAASIGFALDNTIDNDNWRTTSYVNAKPSVGASSSDDTCAVDTIFKITRSSDALATFSSYPPPLMLIFR